MSPGFRQGCGSDSSLTAATCPTCSNVNPHDVLAQAGVPQPAPLGMGERTQAWKELWTIIWSIACKAMSSLGFCNPFAATLQRVTLFFSLIQARLLPLKVPNNTLIFVWPSRDSGTHKLKSVVILPHFRDKAHDCFSFTSTAQANQCWSGGESARVAKVGIPQAELL